ncbi:MULTISPECIES: class II aldolase/adducin family protein [unclassified Paenibacillus]|uniref:class II aldolase/adducin family protein n=1 Tax=unclassified Paenibacillus TaxID=185978 RepID=UPI001AE34B92|nr:MULTISPECIES: class II aldolase/adducin family protein [unclassified Paenibacillus]MBP1155821.1 L-fuculose-phosphate aldolase [Paenibacillus sp. PvP091]MBP1168793.1 L-fuculose-phosphate aldolase [Paenibacillus sp. PvR098]MBP2439821.1 L-fuculose-phosphate aldolase [Paenibacillus sp. PvP052]
MVFTTDSGQLKKRLVQSILMLERAEIIDFNGHCSVRIPGTEQILINSGPSTRNDLSAEDIVTMDVNGTKLEGREAPPMEYHIHTEIYKRRPDVQAVIHAHPRWSTFFSMTGTPLRPVFPQAALLGEIPTFDRIDSINTPELGGRLAEVLGGSRIALLKSHGSVITGSTLEEAFALCIYLEENAKRQYRAQAMGKPYELNDQEIEACARHLGKPALYRKVWEYYEVKIRH